MKPTRRGAVALLLLLGGAAPAAAAEPALPSPAPDYTRAYVAGGIGLALTGLSFWLAEEGDQAYEEYQAGSDPAAIESAYDRAVTYDKLASGALVLGQAALVLAVYWRFLRSPDTPSDARTAAAPRLAPVAVPGGLAVQLRF